MFYNNNEVYDFYIVSNSGLVKYNSKYLYKLFYGDTNIEEFDISNFDY